VPSQLIIPTNFKLRDVLCISVMNSADLDGSIMICARFPLQGIVLVFSINLFSLMLHIRLVSLLLLLRH
jgi:hypothetical protein